MARRKQPAESHAESEEQPAESHVAALEREPGDEPERKRGPNPHSFISDTEAGVTFQTRREPYQAEIVFRDGKPSDEVRAIMRDNGFRWDNDFKAWTFPVGFNTQAQDKLHARKIANQVIDVIREAKGMEPASQDVPAF